MPTNVTHVPPLPDVSITRDPTLMDTQVSKNQGRTAERWVGERVCRVSSASENVVSETGKGLGKDCPLSTHRGKDRTSCAPWPSKGLPLCPEASHFPAPVQVHLPTVSVSWMELR